MPLIFSSFSAGEGKYVGQSEIPTADLINPDKNATLYKFAPGRYRAELHTRLTGGLYPLMTGLLILTYLGNPSSHRQGQGLIVIAACSVILGLRGITIIAEGELRNSATMIYIVWGVPLIAIATATYLLTTDRSVVSDRMLNQTEIFLHMLGKKLGPVRARLLGRQKLNEGAA